jgi:hypothetical protein
MIGAAVRALVRHRAGHRCEYCLLKQEHLPFSTFQVEHIIPRKHGGDDDPTNLAMKRFKVVIAIGLVAAVFIAFRQRKIRKSANWTTACGLSLCANRLSLGHPRPKSGPR